MDLVVLGAGPVGLLAAYLLDADACVGEVPGGAADLRRFAPTFLWRTEATEQLLADLDLFWTGRTVRVGYLDEAGVRDDFVDADRLEYVRRSRGLPPGAPVEVPPSAMSSGRGGELQTFDLSVDDVVRALLGRVSVTQGVVTAVEFLEREGARRVPRARIALRGGAELWTQRVVSTIPAPALDALTRYEGGFFRKTPGRWEAGRKTFVRAPVNVCGPVLEAAAVEYAYVYVVSPDRVTFPYDRVTFPGGGVAVLEFNAEDEPGPVEGELERCSGRLQVRGQVRDAVEFGGALWSVGRLARWSHAVRLHDVVAELYDAA
jgi:hypothetical protein